MPYSYQIVAEHKIVLFKANGVFSSDELLGCLKEVVADSRFESSFNHLVDLREVSRFQASQSDMFMKVVSNHKMQPKLGECRIALLSSNETVYGMTRMYEIMMESTSVAVRTFRKAVDAAEWLDIPEAIMEWKNES